mmetsp:Transcript_38281/g.80552  ORF Transcript_38281/g.80552 Transcript_38281/m.80552 type:complete len:103 (-) Transcript_38281:133-441(-)
MQQFDRINLRMRDNWFSPGLLFLFGPSIAIAEVLLHRDETGFFRDIRLQIDAISYRTQSLHRRVETCIFRRITINDLGLKIDKIINHLSWGYWLTIKGGANE